ncbi:hypothetical protein A2567_03150 [Candidatus Azambacteria bacterium RIFOXYD1_FULL_42_11]|uniref:DnaK suppressor protein n=4 Tax=Candidatus Azamiibacteriota TaxID=1752741 RepID=A0A0G1BIP6_9BACT|nr:MAG: DnaK suppressor protein [Candidatus Azambacteria bacterium GW2011_GWB1_42_17]KKS46151.1 MAG: DnaK suppressor protein [Candidatus Azambacteria bacterium GW2011_GWA1_42_19]KKS75732.1 MAG: DnaK suppressor protein [Candidatus Azambacteria bacterium GW2011_GWA2_42_9]KKS88495.1 MAG: DnaK suppressor protein [Parcubacteria group bacterium GW2011_GWC1_43_11]OGD42025.1 MAG: hypothetical protein A2567_03150 [Candidatus Azambacteria bacterium RIFOXYD1_FULL_42_11]
MPTKQQCFRGSNGALFDLHFILAFATLKPMLDQKNLDELKTALLKERDLLIKELETIATPDTNLEGDWDIKHKEWGEDQITSEEELEGGESVNESDEDMKNKALSDRLELRLKEVNDALKRMDDGTYGTCEVCQKEIPADRLKANPAAKTDIEHVKEIYAG